MRAAADRVGLLVRCGDGGQFELFRSNLGDEVEFMTIMWFASWEAVKAFAGEDYTMAYVPESARALLARFDERSQHYEVRAQEAP